MALNLANRCLCILLPGTSSMVEMNLGALDAILIVTVPLGFRFAQTRTLRGTTTLSVVAMQHSMPLAFRTATVSSYNLQLQPTPQIISVDFHAA